MTKKENSPKLQIIWGSGRQRRRQQGAVHNEPSVIRFASFQLFPAKRELTRDGVPVPPGGRAMDLLLHLTAQAGNVVSKTALLKAVWPDRIVEENNLTVHMAALRRALDGLQKADSRLARASGRSVGGDAVPAGSATGSPGIYA